MLPHSWCLTPQVSSAALNYQSMVVPRVNLGPTISEEIRMAVNRSASTAHSVKSQQLLVSSGNLLGRMMLSSLFVVSGIEKMISYSDTAAYMSAYGTPPSLLPAVIALEFLGGLALAVGYWTRSVAALLAIFTLITALVFHLDFGDATQATMFWKNVTISGGLLLLSIYGPGAWSADSRLA
jgi:putative oxidoreductase